MWGRRIVMDSMYSNDSTLRPEVRSTRQKNTKGRQMAEQKIKTTNPYSGQSEMLTRDFKWDNKCVFSDTHIIYFDVSAKGYRRANRPIKMSEYTVQ